MFKVKSVKERKSNSSSAIKVLMAFAIVVVLIYLIFPYWPKIQYYFNSVSDKDGEIPISYSLLRTEGILLDKPIQADISEVDHNVLKIPKIGVETDIVEGNSLDVLNVVEGVWREPGSSTPLVAGNMVLAGHRFQYLPPNTNTFYNLEELEIGDDIYINWQGIKLLYRVYNTMLVNPDQVEIRKPDPNLKREITLYTCTPLYTSEKRFVVKANLIGYEQL